MAMNTPSIVGIATAAFGLLLFLVSVAGVFWPATPLTDPGMLWTSLVLVLLGVAALLVGRQQRVPETL